MVLIPYYRSEALSTKPVYISDNDVPSVREMSSQLMNRPQSSPRVADRRNIFDYYVSDGDITRYGSEKSLVSPLHTQPDSGTSDNACENFDAEVWTDCQGIDGSPTARQGSCCKYDRLAD